MRVVHCTVVLRDLSMAFQKVGVGQASRPSDPLSGIRLHLMGHRLHFTATDDNVRGAIYHLAVSGNDDFWTVVPAAFHTDLLAAFPLSERIEISRQGSTVIARGVGGGEIRCQEGDRSAFTLGCFAGMSCGWRTVEAGRYWLKGNLVPASRVVFEGRTIAQHYDSSSIFEEVYDEYEEFGQDAETAVGDLDPMAVPALKAAVTAAPALGLALPPVKTAKRLGVHQPATKPAPTTAPTTAPASVAGTAPGVTPVTPMVEPVEPVTVVTTTEAARQPRPGPSA